MKVNGIDFAVIKVENFKFDMNGKVLLQKKWKAFPFEILDENIFSLSGMAPEGPTDLAGMRTYNFLLWQLLKFCIFYEITVTSSSFIAM